MKLEYYDNYDMDYVYSNDSSPSSIYVNFGDTASDKILQKVTDVFTSQGAIGSGWRMLQYSADGGSNFNNVDAVNFGESIVFNPPVNVNGNRYVFRAGFLFCQE